MSSLFLILIRIKRHYLQSDVATVSINMSVFRPAGHII